MKKNFQSDKNYLKSFKLMCEDIVVKNKVENKGLWYTCIAYMAYMLDDKSETAKYLKLANSHAEEDEVIAQISVIELLHLVKYDDDWDAKFQNKVYAGIKEVQDNSEHIYRYNHFFGQLMLALSRKYLEEGKLTQAALFESKVYEGEGWSDNISERYSSWGKDQLGYQAFDLMNENASSEDLDAFFELWNSPKKTKLEKWLFEEMGPWKWRMTDLWATQYLREDKLEKALEIFETIPDSIWRVDNWKMHYHYAQQLDKDPFESNIYSRGYDPYKGKTYTKPEFVKEIMRLKELIEKDIPERSYYALMLGNAYYNMGYNGNSYYYTEYSWSSYEADDFPRDQSSYYSSDRALEYYRLAEQWAPNKKYAAYCYRMQLKCKRDSYYNLEYWKDKYKDDWVEFNSRYPEHAKHLQNCDELMYYVDAWKEG